MVKSSKKFIKNIKKSKLIVVKIVYWLNIFKTHFFISFFLKNIVVYFLLIQYKKITLFYIFPWIYFPWNIFFYFVTL